MKKVFSVLIALAMLISTAVVPMPVSADESVWGGPADVDSIWEGKGTKESPYLITSAAELAGLAKTVYDAISTTNGAVGTSVTGMSNMYSGIYFKLTTDIDLDNKEWTPIGRFGMRFNGNFDGNGHVVKNLNITTTHYAMGLFGATGTNSSISDIGVENVNIVWKNGSAADYNASGDATLHPDSRNRGQAAGGLVGIAGGGTVSDCYARTVTINGSGNAVEYAIGGFIGFCHGTETTKNTVTVTNCYAVNLNLTTNRLVSAFIGANSRDTSVSGCNLNLTNCYVGGTVSMDCGTSGTATNFLSGRYANEIIEKCYTTVSADVITTGENSFATVSDKSGINNVFKALDGWCTDRVKLPINDGYPILEWQRTWEIPDTFAGFTFADISDEKINAVTKNLKLPSVITSDGYEQEISWESSDEDVISNKGIVVSQLSDSKVKLVATSIATDAVKSFEITVLGEISKALLTALNSQSADAVSSDLALPKTVVCAGVTYNVDWRTSDSSVLNGAGKIGNVTVDTPVTLTAYVDSEKFSYNMVVASNAKNKYFYINEGFDGIATCTDISRYTGWENPVGNEEKGVNYTIEPDPTNESNKVVKVERYYGKNSEDGKWYLNGEVQETSGPSRNEAAMVTVDADPDTDGNQPITNGKIQLSAKMMLGTTPHFAAFWFDDLGYGRDNSWISFYTNGFGISLVENWNHNGRLNVGTTVENEWMNVVFVLDIDNAEYKITVTRADGMTYAKSGAIRINPDKPVSISRIGIHSRTADDGINSNTKNSVWYVDDLKISDITLTDAESVAYAKEKLNVISRTSENIVLPLEGEENTTIEWATSDDTVITKDGAVNFATEDKTVTLTATIVKGKEKDTRTFTVTVPGRKAYEIKGIKVTKDSVEAGKLVAGGKVTAVEIINNHSSAAEIYVALFKGNRFMTVAMADLEAGLQSKDLRTVTLENPITLPDDITDCEVKVFIWNGMAPIADEYSSDIPDTTLWMIGDSLMTNYGPNSYPQTGWGTVIGDYISDRVTVKNHAHGGWTTATFLDDTSYDPLSGFIDDVEQGDYAIIGLGINDANPEKNISVSQYKDNYRNIAQQIINKGATPIFTTTTITTNSTETEPNIERYSAQKEAVKALANEMGIVCIDISTEMANRINAEITAGATMEDIRDKYYMWDILENGWDLSGSTLSPTLRDGTHVNVRGANLIADIFADLVKVSASEFAIYVK